MNFLKKCVLLFFVGLTTIKGMEKLPKSNENNHISIENLMEYFNTNVYPNTNKVTDNAQENKLYNKNRWQKIFNTDDYNIKQKSKKEEVSQPDNSYNLLNQILLFQLEQGWFYIHDWFFEAATFAAYIADDNLFKKFDGQKTCFINETKTLATQLGITEAEHLNNIKMTEYETKKKNPEEELLKENNQKDPSVYYDKYYNQTNTYIENLTNTIKKKN